jgi:hypothetical protein
VLFAHLSVQVLARLIINLLHGVLAKDTDPYDHRDSFPRSHAQHPPKSANPASSSSTAAAAAALPRRCPNFIQKLC